MNFKESRILFIILLVAFLVRFYNFNFPYFSSEEAQIAVRGYSLATEGKDELGRSYPILFNSLSDYKLPITSYLTAVGIKLFGKSDFGARIPFVLIGIGVVFLLYKISHFFNQKKEFSIFVGILAALSPPLIFLSRVPNESIVLIFLLLLLFSLLIKEKINLVWMGLVITLSLATSKAAWWIITPLTVFTLFIFQNSLHKQIKIKASVIVLVLTLSVVVLFLSVPQSKRSLEENNFSIFSDISIQNGINKLRGHGIESDWPPFLERILFNKSEYLILGFLNWMSNLNPSVYFGTFDLSGKLNFTQIGLFTKVLIVPFIFGLAYIISRGSRKDKSLILFSLILTFPSFFTLHGVKTDLVVLTVPFLILIIGMGLINLKKALTAIVLIMFLELLMLLVSHPLEVKATNNQRPSWVTVITEDVYNKSLNGKVAVSDDIVEDIVQYISWNNTVDVRLGFLDVPSPYRFRQTKIGNIRLIGSDNEFYNCGLDKPGYIIASKRDLKEILQHLNIMDDTTIEKIYKDNKGNDVAYLIRPIICIKGF